MGDGDWDAILEGNTGTRWKLPKFLYQDSDAVRLSTKITCSLERSLSYLMQIACSISKSERAVVALIPDLVVKLPAWLVGCDTPLFTGG